MPGAFEEQTSDVARKVNDEEPLASEQPVPTEPVPEEQTPSVYDEAKMRSLVVKDGVDAHDRDDGRWAAAVVKEIKEEGLLMSYRGFSAKYDKMYTWAEHERLADPWTKVWKTKPKAPPKRKKASKGQGGKKAKIEEKAEPEASKEDQTEHIWVESPEGKSFQLEGEACFFHAVFLSKTLSI